MTQGGPAGASGTLHTPGPPLRSEAWKAAQAAFLAGRTSRRAARKTRNTQKSVQNADRTNRRTAAGVTLGAAGDTFGLNEPLESDSDDDFEVPEPPTVPTTSTTNDAQAIVTIMKDLNPAAQQMFLTLMTSMRTTTPASLGGPVTSPAPSPERPAALPRIFNPAAVQPARSDENYRTPFSPRVMELAIAGAYLERSIFTNERIHDMFVNQGDPKYQPKKRIITGDDGKTVTTYTIDPSVFEDETTLSYIRFDEAHANYRRWFVENAPVEAAGQLEAYDNHRQRCRDVDLVDEKDFIMVQRWCRSWMQRQTWRPTTWDEGTYHKEFEASRARYFESKLSQKMSELERHTQRQDREPSGQRYETPRSKSTYLGPERTSSSSFPERTSPYSRERGGGGERSFRKDVTTTALCLKCGDTGHMARECCATKTVKGGPSNHGACDAKNANLHCHACTLCGTTKHHAASGKC